MNAPLSRTPGVRTTCPYCGVGCGVIAKPGGDGVVAISGDADHPANAGRLCSKGSALGETLSLDGRLLHPMLRTRAGGYERATWDDALHRVAEGFRTVEREHGADALAFYLSGQLLTEDYYVANKLMKGFLGSANVDTNSRLCMASSVAGHKRAFGADVVPGVYADLDEADLIVLVGSNAAWCHPVLYQRMIANRTKRGAKLVVIDPRRTASAEDADLFLPLAAGMDSVLYAFLLTEIARRGDIDRAFVRAHTHGFEEAVAQSKALAPDIATVARATGLNEAAIRDFCNLWISAPKTVTAWSQGVNQSAQGTDKVGAIVNCHLATGRIGKPGQGPFSLTGQPNAMGGREVGGLANMLAAHMGFSPQEVDRVRRFWKAPRMAEREGLKAVEMFDAIAARRIRALWVMATNPAVSLPRADDARRAMAGLDFFVVSEVMASNDTLACGAHVLLPAAAWGEKNGTVTNSERRISRQRPFLPLPGEAQPDWWIVCEVAKRMGFPAAFAFQSPAAIFREHAALSAFENEGRRAFDIGGLKGACDVVYDRMQPIQWPAVSERDLGGRRLFGDGAFFTPDKKARFVRIEPPRLAQPPHETAPLLLNTGRLRDQWHTMTRTGKSPRLASHAQEPFVALSTHDADAAGLRDGGLARLASPQGESILRVRIDAGQPRGTVFAPIHWTAQTSSHGRIGALVGSAVDPFSGQPELKASAVSIEPVAHAFAGFFVTRENVAPPPGSWWSKVALAGASGYLIATNENIAASAEWFAAITRGCEIAEYEDAPRGVWRGAAFRDGRLEMALFLGPFDDAPAWTHVKALVASEDLGERARRYALSTRDADGAADCGPTVCACYGVGLATIVEAIRSGQGASVAEIGKKLRAGTNCGSCVPELRKIVAGARVGA